MPPKIATLGSSKRDAGPPDDDDDESPGGPGANNFFVGGCQETAFNEIDSALTLFCKFALQVEDRT